jgi:hypothetical protein
MGIMRLEIGGSDAMQLRLTAALSMQRAVETGRDPMSRKKKADQRAEEVGQIRSRAGKGEASVLRAAPRWETQYI